MKNNDSNKKKSGKLEARAEPIWREITIMTNGSQWKVVKADCTPLELIAIAHGIIERLGGGRK